MRSGFHSLPDEIIENILSHNDSQVTLRNLTLCSKALYHVFFPYLYRDIRIWDVPRSKALRVLAVKLLSCSDVAERAQSLTLRNNFSTNSYISDLRWKLLANRSPCKLEDKEVNEIFEQGLLEDCGQTGPLGAQFNSLCEKTIKSRYPGFRETAEKFIRALRRTDEDALVTLLLQAMPNLRCLDMTVPSHAHFLGQEYLQSSTFILDGPDDPVVPIERSDRLLTQLTEVKLGVDKETLTSSSENMIGTLLLLYHLLSPSMRRIYIRNLPTSAPDATGGHIFRGDLSSMSSNVTHLEIREFTISIKTLVKFVKMCHSLRTFIYEHATACWRPEIIQKVLDPIKMSLETLWLGFGSLRWPSSNFREPMHTLSDFKGLKRLRLPMRLVFSTSLQESSDTCISDFIPSSLEVLHLKDCNYKSPELLQTLHTLVLNKPEYAPALKEITVDIPFADVGVLWYCFLEPATQSGISVTLRDCSSNSEFTKKGWGWDEASCWIDDDSTHRSYNSRRVILPTVTKERFTKVIVNGHLLPWTEHVPPWLEELDERATQQSAS